MYRDGGFAYGDVYGKVQNAMFSKTLKYPFYFTPHSPGKRISYRNASDYSMCDLHAGDAIMRLYVENFKKTYLIINTLQSRHYKARSNPHLTE